MADDIQNKQSMKEAVDTLNQIAANPSTQLHESMYVSAGFTVGCRGWRGRSSCTCCTASSKADCTAGCTVAGHRWRVERLAPVAATPEAVAASL